MNDKIKNRQLCLYYKSTKKAIIKVVNIYYENFKILYKYYITYLL